MVIHAKLGSAHPYSKSDVFFAHSHFLRHIRRPYGLQRVKKVKNIGLKKEYLQQTKFDSFPK